jgi:hypothetical protein
MVIFRMEGWEEKESKEVKEKGKKQINRQVGKNKTKNQTKKFQRYKQVLLVY